jgi:3D (Asp-Asp-Asp) domain-containing protein
MTRYLKLQYAIAAFVPLVIVTLSITGFVWAQKRVTVVVDGQCLHVETQAADVASLLHDAGVAVDGDDVVSPGLDSAVDDRMSVVVRHSVPVTIDLGSGPMKVDVVGETVADALVAAGVKPDSHPAVNPDVSTPLKAGMSISVPGVFVRLAQEEETTTPPVETHPDSSMPRGTKRVIATGSPGRVLRVYRMLVAGGVEGDPVLTKCCVLNTAEPRIIAVGTGESNTMTAAVNRTYVVGRPPKRGRKMRVEATGYSPLEPGLDYTTSTGARAQHGVIAVDPRVIPYGTHVWVPGYGYAVAADCGGAIKRNRIDLCFDTVAEAIQWGRRTVTIIILD